MKLTLKGYGTKILNFNQQYFGDLENDFLQGQFCFQERKILVTVFSIPMYRLRKKNSAIGLKKPIPMGNNNGIQVNLCFDYCDSELCKRWICSRQEYGSDLKSRHTKKNLIEILNDGLKSQGIDCKIEEVEII